MKVEIAVENLREIKDILDKNGVGFWLDSGTLLGAVRDGKIIEWDIDIDLGAWYNNVTQLISIFPEFKKRGFSVFLNRKLGIMTILRGGVDNMVAVGLYRQGSGCAWNIWIVGKKKVEKVLYRCVNMANIRVYAKNPLKNKYFLSVLPLTLKQLIANTAWSQLNRLGCNFLMAVPKRFFEKLGCLEFYGMKFNVPSDVEDYLAYRYGDWRVPVRDWVCCRDDGAIYSRRANGIRHITKNELVGIGYKRLIC
jgi:phosphorylcholine metabolism protein LicD